VSGEVVCWPFGVTALWTAARVWLEFALGICVVGADLAVWRWHARPVTVLDAAKQGARRVHDRLPPRFANGFRKIALKITGT